MKAITSFAEGNLTNRYEGDCVKWLTGKGKTIGRNLGVLHVKCWIRVMDTGQNIWKLSMQGNE